jgi:hypothetical protein
MNRSPGLLSSNISNSMCTIRVDDLWSPTVCHYALGSILNILGHLVALRSPKIHFLAMV